MTNAALPIGHPNKIPNLCDKTRNILDGYVTIEEKLDGSQITFMADDEGNLFIRSKGRMIDWLNLAEMDLFHSAVFTITELHRAGSLIPGWRYSGEAFKRAEVGKATRHNVLVYDQPPLGSIALFDIKMPGGEYAPTSFVQAAAQRLCIGYARTLFEGTVTDMDQLNRLLELESQLGGPGVEGLVIKARERLDKQGHPLMVKYVAPKFREKAGAGKRKNVDGVSPAANIGALLKTEARWNKAIQHLRDDDKLTETPKDIGPLMQELARDIEEEEGEWIKEALYKAYRKNVLKVASNGFPQYYKQMLGMIS